MMSALPLTSNHHVHDSLRRKPRTISSAFASITHTAIAPAFTRPGWCSIRTTTGAKALNGEPETIPTTMIFEAAKNARKITAKGKLIQIYKEGAPTYWEYENKETESTKDVPAGYEVRVVNATIWFH
ncbi:hypothetical protein BS50DRAFT_200180 [Corynespora cassiicola Philippines]|uniref:Uncharacterized protein n=1 Tax=Corynespora cassiicola Philippines TaxID=1448308 RepID=A0A2T2N645_CORCC|nr:hypothetical protein BS50DRAFT_200180 [Corynespora cassiicola Philippines]